jgi:hypothetical protein
MIALNAALNSGRLADPPMVIAGVVVVVAVGGAGIWVHSRYVRAADEFVRRIEMESLALAFGMATVISIALWQLTRADIITDWRDSTYAFYVLVPAMITSRIIVLLRYR